MRTTHYVLSLVAALATTISASADTVTVSLSDTASGESASTDRYRTSTLGSQASGFAPSDEGGSVSASTLTSWLNNYTTEGGWLSTSANGGNIAIWDTSTITTTDSGVDLSLYNRKAYGGSIVGTHVSLDTSMCSLEDYTGLTLSIDVTSLYNGDPSTVYAYLVYQVDNTWTMSYLQLSTDTSTQTITVDLTEGTLTSSTVYVAISSGAGNGDAEIAASSVMSISLTATANGGAVPEPATASLSLLGLGALLLRRRRH